MRETDPFFAYLRPTGEQVEFRFSRAANTRYIVKSIDGDAKPEVSLAPHETAQQYAERWMAAEQGARAHPRGGAAFLSLGVAAARVSLGGTFRRTGDLHE